MKTQLSPFVYKVKGKNNYLLFDSLQGQNYHIIPEGSPHELEAALLENGLVIKTNGAIPFKFRPNLDTYKKKVALRELQIRVSGTCSFSCEDCGKTGYCVKDNSVMTKNILNRIISQFEFIKVETVSLSCGNPILNVEIIEFVRKNINAANYRILCASPRIFEFEDEIKKMGDIGFTVIQSICNNGPIEEEKMSVDVSEFFYNQEFNPCWGHKIAIDCDGTLKPCLWSDRNFGNIIDSDIRRMIFAHEWDEVWETSKDKIEVCKECEYRYSCKDCRVLAEKDSPTANSKTKGCQYNP